MEILLCYIELAQYQCFVQSHLNENEMYHTEHTDISTVTVADDIIVPSIVPLSAIIESIENVPNDIDGSESDNMDVILYNAKIKAHKLFNKYVKCGSEYEINIQYEQRNELQTVLSDLDGLLKLNMSLKDLYSLFDDCKNEMVTLLTFSLTRFKETKEFEEIDPNSLQIFVKSSERTLSLHNVEMA